MAQPNGGGAAPGGPYATTNGGGGGGEAQVAYAKAGHYADVQTLMEQMDMLSTWLARNREEWGAVREGLGRVERGRASGLLPLGQAVQVNGEGGEDGKEATGTQPTVSQLQNQLADREAELTTLKESLQTYHNLQTLYEETLSDATERIRTYIFQQQSHIISLHQHYTALLAQSRNETIEAQLVHQGWQAGLQKLSAELRQAYNAREEERVKGDRPLVGRVRGLKEENRVLRKMVGWEVPPDSDEEEGEDDGRGRGELGNCGGGGEGVGQ
jgi:hypothetical protein